MVKNMNSINIDKPAKTSSLRYIILFIIITPLLCGVVSCIIILKSCIFLNCVEERTFNALDLDLPADYFPNDATITPIHRPSESQGAFESASISVYWEEGNKNAGYRVWRFRTEEEASRAFKAEARESRYIDNKDSFYQSSVADEFAVGCGLNFGYRCNMAARYKEYTINLVASIDDEMSVEKFNEAVIYIDQEMERRLYTENEN